MSLLHAQVDLFTETFDEFNGATTGVSDEGIPWTADCSACSPSGSYSVMNGTLENNNTDGVAVWFTDPIDISSCSRITLTIDYSGEPFDSPADCGANVLDGSLCCTGCSGDPEDAGSPDCEFCWDFMDFRLNIDGVYSDLGIIGTTNTPTSFQIDYDETNCPNLGNSAFIEVRSQTWAADEFMRFDNVMMVCYEDGPEGTLTGTGDLCPGQCVDLDWDVSGGEAPYNLSFEVSAGGFSLTQGLPGLPNMGSLTVCYDDGGGLPSFDVPSNTLNLTDFFGTSYQIELLNITDNAGCTTMLSGQVIDITLGSSPTINSIPPIEICESASGTTELDLTDFDAAIGGGQTVEYYSDMGLTNPIGPIIIVSGNTTIFAVVNAGAGCVSDPISIDIEFQQGPQIEDPGPIESCGEYILPEIDGTNLTGSVGYWTGPNQGGAPLTVGTIITTDIVVFIYDEGNGCPSEVSFSIDILPQPELVDVPTVVACGSYELPQIFGNNLSGNENYYTQPNGGGMQFSEGDMISDDIVLYIYDEIGMCSDEVILIISITDGPEIIMPDTLIACDVLLLPSVEGNDLSDDASYFTGQSGTGNQINPGTGIASSTTIYAYDGEENCFDEQEIEVIIPMTPDLDQPADVTECNFYIFPTIGGNDLQSPGILVNGMSFFPGDTLFASEEVLICDSIVNDPISFNGEEFNCAVCISYQVTIMESADAGSDVAFNDCGGSVLNLEDIIDVDADEGGLFIDTSSTGAITGNMLDASLINGNTFSFFYEVENMCGIDTAVYTLSITDVANAGGNTSTSVCEDEELDLIDYTNGDIGGVFVNTNDNSMPTTINSNIIVDAGGSLLFYYIVGQGGTCEPDTAEVNFVIVNTPTVNLGEDQLDCDAVELPDINGTGLAGNESYNTEPDGSGTTFEVGDTLFNSDILYVLSGSGLCATSDTIEYTIINVPPTIIQETICLSDTLEVNGEQFYEGNEMGSQLFTSVDGCDSIVEVTIDFFELDTNFINEEVCWGGEFEIFGVTLDADQPSVQLNIPLIGQNGCDSIIFVNLTFEEPLTRSIEESLCENDSIEINGVFYSINNPSGTDTVFVEGTCDTILFIDISFDESVSILVDDFLCPGSSIMVGGQTFDEDNPSGEFTIPGPSGCDTTVTVDLSFYEEAVGSLTGSFCEDEIIDTLGQQFDINNPEMEIILPGASAQNCDSTVFVSFTFGSSIESFLDTILCTDDGIMVGDQLFDSSNPEGQVVFTSQSGCDSIVNVTYGLASSDADLSVIQPTCDMAGAYIVFNGYSETSDEYFYTFDTGIPATQINIGDTIYNILPGEYEIIFFTIENPECPSLDSIFADEPTELEFMLPVDTVYISEGESFDLDISEVDEYSITWEPPFDISCTDCATPTFTPPNTTNYSVTITDSIDCFAMDNFVLIVEQVFDYYVPNTFTPNDDGLNDVFYIFSETDIPYSMSIFDRWGNRVFEGVDLTTNDFTQGWDGRFNGRLVSQGVYSFKVLLQIEEDKDPVLQYGTITIVR